MALKRITKGGTDYRIGITEPQEGAEMAITEYYTLGFVGDLVCILYNISYFEKVNIYMKIILVSFRIRTNYW